jgi:aspartate ammonia-lyase
MVSCAAAATATATAARAVTGSAVMPVASAASDGRQAFRVEHDLLGDRQVPAAAYYGIQTMRARENYQVTGIPLSHFPNLVRALAMVKKAAAMANADMSLIPSDVRGAIVGACDDIIGGKLHEQFVVDLIQGGAGTSTNMNANEVIANRALEILGEPRGNYARVHPNDHVNRSQSTNDAYPTAVKIAILLDHEALVDELRLSVQAFRERADAFSHVLKMGRTQLQDAVPMTLGQVSQNG